MKQEPCKNCGRPIVWAQGPRGGLVPYDAKPDADGTAFLYEQDGKLFGGIVTRGQAAGMRAQGKELHQPHRFTCPNADMWVKAKDKEPRFRARR